MLLSGTRRHHTLFACAASSVHCNSSAHHSETARCDTGNPVEASNIDAFHGQHNAPIVMEDQAGASTTNANPAAPPAAIPNVARCLVADKCGLTDGLSGDYSSCNDEGIDVAGCVVLPSTGDIIELLPQSFVAECVATLETAVATAHLLIPPQLHECLQGEQQQSFEDLTLFAAFEEEAAAQADAF
jgi:hypothetical protein